MNPATQARRRLVRRLLAGREIANQEELRALLEEEGFVVTQATVSRDLDAVGAIKVADGNGGHYAVVAAAAERSRDRGLLQTALDQFVDEIAICGTLVVVRVPPGAAHLVAGRIDGASVDGVLGTVAGDDTIFVAADDGVGVEAVARFLEGGAR